MRRLNKVVGMMVALSFLFMLAGEGIMKAEVSTPDSRGGSEEPLRAWEFPPGVDKGEYMKGAPSSYPLIRAAFYTGPYAAVCQQVRLADLDIARYTNDMGGLRGVPVDCILYDTKGDLSLSLATLENICAQKPRVTWYDTFLPDETAALSPYINEHKILGVGGGGAIFEACYPQEFENEYVLQFSVTWEEELLDLVLWMVAKNPDIKKIGVIELDVPYIRAIVDKTLGSKAEKLLGEMGVELMKPERMGLMALDATPQMIKMKRAKPDAIVLAMAMHAPPIVAKAASAVKMKIGKDCVFLVPYVGFDHSLLLSLKDGGLLTEGWYGSIMSPSPDQPEITGVKEVMEVAKGYGRRARRDAGVIYITTFAMHMLHPETVGMALDELGGWENWEERLTPELIRKQYLKMNDYRSIFDVRTFTFLPGKVTCQGNLIGTIQGEDMVQASDWHWAPNLSTIFSMERWEDPPMEVILKDYPQASLHWLLSTYLPWEEKPEESLTAVAKFWSEYRDTGEVKIGEYTLDLYEPLPEGTSLEEAKAILKVAQERYL